MNMEFKRKLPTPQTIRDMYPVSPELARQKQANDHAVRDVLTGEDDRLMLLIGRARPTERTRCSTMSRACAACRRR